MVRGEGQGNGELRDRMQAIELEEELDRPQTAAVGSVCVCVCVCVNVCLPVFACVLVGVLVRVKVTVCERGGGDG